LRGAPLSKSAISRIVGRLQALFTDWRQRSLKEETVVFVYLDAIALRVRIANKVISAPVLVGLGVRGDGQKAVLDLELLQSESSECWGGFVEGLVNRGLKRPSLGDHRWEQRVESCGGEELAWDQGAALHGA
jgi:putative transposase